MENLSCLLKNASYYEKQMNSNLSEFVEWKKDNVISKEESVENSEGEVVFDEQTPILGLPDEVRKEQLK